MTMPKTAKAVRALDLLPQDMSSEQLETALSALRSDLPGDPLGYVDQALSSRERCDCGALHLAVDAADLDHATRSSLHRLLATPFGDIVRERVRRQSPAVTTVRFGWSGLEQRVPTFVRVVDIYDARRVHAHTLDDQTLANIIEAIRKDLPGVMQMLDDSLSELSVNAVGPAPDDEGRREWKALIDQVMFAFSTPVRKYLDEYARRQYDGAQVGAVNCCIVMSARMSANDWQQRWFDEQVGQQLTPDC